MGTTQSTGDLRVASGNTGYGQSATFASVQLRASGSVGATAGGQHPSEHSGLLANDHYNAASGMPQSPTRGPVMGMSKDEALGLAAALAEEAKPEARTDSSIVRPATCSNEPHVAAMRKAMKKGDCQALRDMVAADPFLLVARDMVFWRTALHIAAAAGKTDVVLILLQAGADVLLKDKYGETPYDLAKRYRHSNAASVLKDATKAEKARRREAVKLATKSHGGKGASRSNGTSGKRHKSRRHGRSKSDDGQGVSAHTRGAGHKGGRGKHRRSKSHAAKTNGTGRGVHVGTAPAPLSTINEASGEVEHKGMLAASDSEDYAGTSVDAAAPPSESGQSSGRAGSGDSVGVVGAGAPIAVATLRAGDASHGIARDVPRGPSKAEDPRGARLPAPA